jgi:hypothetical protein
MSALLPLRTFYLDGLNAPRLKRALCRNWSGMIERRAAAPISNNVRKIQVPVLARSQLPLAT